MINAISDISIKKNTGKTWKEWIAILNAQGATNWSHQEIVSFLKRKHSQTLWWQQMIANGYEVATGKRIAGQSLKGTYSLTVTKTALVDSKKAWKWLVSKKGLEFWLRPLSDMTLEKGAAFEIEGGIFGEVRTLKSGHRVRLAWQEEDWAKATVVQVYIIPRPKQRTMLVIQHDGLQRARQKLELRTYWREIIDGMPAQIAGLYE